MLKEMIVGFGIEPAKTHDLYYLAEYLSEVSGVPVPRRILDGCSLLNAVYLERYPKNSPESFPKRASEKKTRTVFRKADEIVA